MTTEKPQRTLYDFVKTLIIPLIINKVFMLYFGINFSNHPGEGFGYGLIATVLFLIINIGVFLWKYRDIEDP